jgi:hypothetical protein
MSCELNAALIARRLRFLIGSGGRNDFVGLLHSVLVAKGSRTHYALIAGQKAAPGDETAAVRISLGWTTVTKGI